MRNLDDDELSKMQSLFMLCILLLNNVHKFIKTKPLLLLTLA
ncbi:hypothetical protein GPUN_1585 [Glaciecola punicea ACAM 611]|uniref:Uncharacterized protein n=1 Tax=Glaciecola punicea ACAM 611 TaxID=1121923 RepID=H5TBM5_9ALTE|nr:hypothetical protein GPUN_1585 [Glaciecola punicea ACAM 611]